MRSLESYQVYSDKGPYLNPSDHPYEQDFDEREEIICSGYCPDCGAQLHLIENWLHECPVCQEEK
jgi:hypothetical protein